LRDWPREGEAVTAAAEEYLKNENEEKTKRRRRDS
jgi:hypothetical protein